MAVKKKVVEVDTSNAQKSVKSMRQELKELKDQLVNLDKGTKEYSETLQKAANIQHELKEMNEQLAASAMDFGQILGNVTTTIGGAISGFQALSASMTLLGVENEEALESIKKLQALMALTQGIAGIEKGIKSFKRLMLLIQNSTILAKMFSSATTASGVAAQGAAVGTNALSGAMTADAAATGTATVATHAFKKALISTGIGAIVVAVGLLIANLDKLINLFRRSGDSAASAKKQLEEFNKAAASANSTVAYYEGQLKKVQLSYKPILAQLKQHVDLLKAQGASQAEIAAAEDAYHTKYMEYLEQEQKAINLTNTKLAETIDANNKLQGDLGKPVNAKNVYAIMANYQRLILEQEPKLENASKKEKERMEANAKRWQGQIDLLKQYAANVERLVDIDVEAANTMTKTTEKNGKKVVKIDKNTNAERIANRKKLIEDLAKFDEQLLLDGLKNKAKELAQVDKTEKEKIKTLKEYRKQGIVSKKEYEKRLTEIKALYSAQRVEIEAKYAQSESKKREDILKKQFDVERKELDRQKTELNAFYKQENQDNTDALRRREISIVDYYNNAIDIANKKYAEERKLMEAEYQKETAFIEQQLEERYELLGNAGLTDEERSKIAGEQNELIQQLAILETNHAVALADLATETSNTIADLNQSVIEEQMESLRMLTENVVSSMDAITSIGQGLSSEWATAFDTMSNGLINLGQKIKEGGAQWQDYGQLAVAAFQAAGSVMSALADQQETETKEGFEQQKKYQIAAVTMNMLGGVISAWTSAMNPANAWMTIWGQLAMGAASTAMILATGIMQIQKIKQQKFESGGSSASPSGGAMSNIVAPVQYTQDVQGAEIEGAIKDSKVYVVESDITDAQNRVDVTENEAKY